MECALGRSELERGLTSDFSKALVRAEVAAPGTGALQFVGFADRHFQSHPTVGSTPNEITPSGRCSASPIQRRRSWQIHNALLPGALGSAKVCRIPVHYSRVIIIAA